MAAMRRVARQTLFWTEHAPAAAPCPACTRPYSHAVSLPPTTQQGPQASTSAWNTLQQASRAFLQTGEASQAVAATPRHPVPSSTSTPLPAAVGALVGELKSKRPDGGKAWALFEDLDLQGQSYLIPLQSLHFLLSAIRPRASNRGDMTVKKATRAAQAFETKADLVRLAIRQAGGKLTPGDFKALIAGYQAIGYGPGAIKAWEEALQCGVVPGSEARMSAFKALAYWVDLNYQADMNEAFRSAQGAPTSRSEPGKAVARVVGRRMYDMLLHETSFVPAHTSPTLDSTLNSFFAVLARAGDLDLVRPALKSLYGINIDLPGGLIDATVADRARLRAIGERDVVWMLRSLGATGDMDRLIGLFEYFDRPSQVDLPFVDDAPPPNAYFTSQGYDSQPSAPANFESQSHLVGTSALVAVIQAAADALNLPLVCHYFDMLLVRHADSTHARLREIEQAVGMPDVPSFDPLDAEVDLVDDAPEPEFAHKPTGTSLASEAAAHLALSPSEPSEPWALPTWLIGRVVHLAYANAEAGTLKWAVARMKRIVRLRQEEVARMEAVIKAIQPSLEALETANRTEDVKGDVATVEHLPADLLDPILSYLRDSYDGALQSLNSTRVMFDKVKLLNRIVVTEDRLRTQTYEVSRRERRLADAALNKQQYIAVLRQKDKKATNVLAHKVYLAKYKLAKLRHVDGLGRGHWQYDYWSAQLRKLADEVYRKQQEEQWMQQTGSRGRLAGRTAADFTAGIRAAVAADQQAKEAQAAALAEAKFTEGDR